MIGLHAWIARNYQELLGQCAVEAWAMARRQGVLCDRARFCKAWSDVSALQYQETDVDSIMDARAVEHEVIGEDCVVIARELRKRIKRVKQVKWPKGHQAA